MSIFETPGPISLAVELNLGDVRITASDRTDTAVDVRPSNESKGSDVRAAEQTRVEYFNGTLLIKGPKEWKRYAILSGNGSIDVDVRLPSHSDVRGDAGMGTFQCDGELGRCDLRTGMGTVRLDRTASMKAESGYGDIIVDRAAGNLEAKTGSGDITIRGIDGSAHIKNSDGDIDIDEIAGDLHVKAANGDISIGRAQASISAKSANGNVRVEEITRGSVVLETAAGNVAVGIAEGTTAWLDASTQYGHVRNSLSPSSGPDGGGETAEIRARTSYGDIEAHRSVRTRLETESRSRPADPQN
ncbi:DUF4097 family beta strand repeat-containing protein [Arthrobacter sp. Br18]|uniref:DUF4097 family beta strand repeat-containing protein n=1 Tax=Arthrobacter sp. Br18 TaxID=1312954 RepID=UPI0004B02805|nr:DUF4097 family beta strand repeat-containing protein [Arthrobacter sp. Br18]